MCKDIPGCNVIGGICSSHPCPDIFFPYENNSCPSGCIKEERIMLNENMGIISRNIDIKINKKTDFKRNEFNFDIKDINKFNLMNFDNNEKNKNLKMLLCENEETNTERGNKLMRDQKTHLLMRDSSVVCVFDTCASYENESCLSHTEEKCIPTIEGCRLLIDICIRL
jgi:hypothetical protein